MVTLVGAHRIKEHTVRALGRLVGCDFHSSGARIRTRRHTQVTRARPDFPYLISEFRALGRVCLWGVRLIRAEIT